MKRQGNTMVGTAPDTPRSIGHHDNAVSARIPYARPVLIRLGTQGDVHGKPYTATNEGQTFGIVYGAS